LAARILREARPDTRSRAEHGFRLCVARKPSPTEVDRLVTWIDYEKQKFDTNPADAGKVARHQPVDVNVSDAEFAAWSLLANTLLNLDETVTKQ
jgi:hypothetical protein